MNKATVQTVVIGVVAWALLSIGAAWLHSLTSMGVQP